MEKNKAEAGADRRTPSIPQYFSWINNTNEGATEKQTLINLAFFEWLKETYGMQIKIYAWDAGNFDGAGDGYGDENSERLHTQYPNGYAPIVKKAEELGIRLGIWGGPDGFGDTEEDAKKRFDFMVGLCKKYHFALFKIDGVCGELREEKAKICAEMLKECRKYSPDLVVLNHRLNFYEAEKYVTTFLWQSTETYVDVHSRNHTTCMHHRGFIFDRGLPENLERLAEDHGVCISSAIAYFEDDLIYQAFGRCMILAPEIYGNPWLMRDDEFPKLARVYNLHKHCAELLVDGMVLPDTYGANAVSRGNGTHRFITTGNSSWEKKEIEIALNKECGLETDEKVILIQRHPTEKVIGIYEYGEKVKVTLMPFRAHLFEVATLKEANPVLEGCEYQMIQEDEDGRPVKVHYLTSNGGTVFLLENGIRSPFGETPKVDCAEKEPLYLGTMADEPEAVTRGEELYEAACFGIDNDSFEARELRRAGTTKIPQVQAARDAFFSQKTYLARGCEGRYAFDGNPDTFFDGCSRYYFGSTRIDGGCLRVDFGKEYDADTVEITCFSIDKPIYEVYEQLFTECGEYASDYTQWHKSEKAMLTTVEEEFYAPVVLDTINFMSEEKGKLIKAVYPVGKLRYFRLSEPMDRIYSIKLLKDGKELSLEHPRVNNLQAPYGAKKVAAVQSCEINLPRDSEGKYLAVALNGVHGEEGAYCVAEVNGALVAFPDRAASYAVNMWEHHVMAQDENYTYYLPIDNTMSGKKVKLYTLFCNQDKTDVTCDIYLCPQH